MNDILNLPNEKFEFVQLDDRIHDAKFETKPIGYFSDAIRRFSRNKASVFAFAILVIIVLFAIFIPIFNKEKVERVNVRLGYLSPRIPLLENLGITTGYKEYDILTSRIVTPDDPSYSASKIASGEQYDTTFIVSYGEPYVVNQNGSDFEYRKIVYDHYKFLAQPYEINNVTSEEFDRLLQIEGAILEVKGVIHIPTPNGDVVEYRLLVDPSIVENYSADTYYIFGTDALGRDLWSLVWLGARTSLLIGLFTAVVTIIFGVIWGSISGYFGGSLDLIMERFTEILGGIPWLVVMTLIKLYLGGTIFTVALALVLTSWIGTASTVRSQFYRYKGREYVLASRTLGAKDKRLIFKHILPNALGPIVTSSVLIIPSAVFFESNVSYLGIGVTDGVSIGNLLSNGQGLITSFPHLTLGPAIIISILMIAFNLFGNGLRDALNPTLRGAS